MFGKIKEALGKKTIASSVGMIIFQLAAANGLPISAELREQITIILAAVIAIFLRLGVEKAEKAKKEKE